MQPSFTTMMKTWSIKQFICFQKRTYVLTMRGISKSFISEDDVGVSAVQADGNSQAMRRSTKTLYFCS
jgi:hypothetical protein